ncbi:hypothetical protein GCM10022222_09550 [Amycolatopsis ultiminotia]|uniref:MFS transporter n=1 Tax=Amycolatopsis ultiminotia TaxID=543629 RepID=A0ABP6V483_9PSEU
MAGLLVDWPLATSLAGRSYLRIGFRGCAAIGITLVVIGSLTPLPLDEHSRVLQVTASCFVIGLGMDTTTNPTLVGAQSSVGWNDRGVVTANNLFLRSIGSSAGVALFGAIANTRLGPASDEHPESALLAEAAHGVFVAIAGVAIIAAVVVACLPRRQKLRAERRVSGEHSFDVVSRHYASKYSRYRDIMVRNPTRVLASLVAARTPEAAGTLFIAQAAGEFLGGLAGGGLAVGFGRRRTLPVPLTGATLSCGTLAAVTAPTVAIVVFLAAGVFESAFHPTVATLVGAVPRDEDLPRAHDFLRAGANVGRVAGPLIGAAVALTALSAVFALNGLLLAADECCAPARRPARLWFAGAAKTQAVRAANVVVDLRDPAGVAGRLNRRPRPTSSAAAASRSLRSRRPWSRPKASWTWPTCSATWCPARRVSSPARSCTSAGDIPEAVPDTVGLLAANPSILDTVYRYW